MGATTSHARLLLWTAVAVALALLPAPALAVGQETEPELTYEKTETAPEFLGRAVWHLNTAKIVVENGCTDGLPQLNKIIRNRPDDIEAFYTRGACYSLAGEYGRALADYQAALNLKPRDVGAWNAVARAYENLQDWGRALTTYQRARVIDPRNARAAEGVGASLYHLGRNIEALAALNEAIRLYAHSYLLFAYRGSTFIRLRRYAEAEADLKRSTQMMSSAIAPRILLADVYGRQGRHVEQVQTLEQALKRDPGNQSIARRLASARGDLAKSGSAPAAAPATPQVAAPPPARSYPPVNPRSALGRGIALYLDVEYQQALPVLTEATKADPKDPRAFAYLAAAYYKLGLTREFEAARDRAVALDPGIMRVVP